MPILRLFERLRRGRDRHPEGERLEDRDDIESTEEMISPYVPAAGDLVAFRYQSMITNLPQNSTIVYFSESGRESNYSAISANGYFLLRRHNASQGRVDGYHSSGYKVHISVDITRIEEVFNAILPILIEYGIDEFKVARTGISGLQSGKEIVIYTNIKSDFTQDHNFEYWQNVFTAINQALNGIENLQPGPIPNFRFEEESTYAGEIIHESALAGSRYLYVRPYILKQSERYCCGLRSKTVPESTIVRELTAIQRQGLFEQLNLVHVHPAPIGPFA